MTLTSPATRIMEKDGIWAQKNSRLDYCYLSAIWAPYADEEALRVILDWNNWVDPTHVILDVSKG